MKYNEFVTNIIEDKILVYDKKSYLKISNIVWGSVNMKGFQRIF